MKKRNKRHCGEGAFLRRIAFPHVPHKALKNGRFTYEPSVLCSTLAKAAGAAKESCSANDFLLRGRFARESRRAGAADTGRDKAEEGGIPAAVFRPTTTQDVPASVRLRGCASRASRPFFLLKRKEDVRLRACASCAYRPFFLLKRKEGGTFSFLEEKKQKTLRDRWFI